MYTEAKKKSAWIKALLNARSIQQGEIARALKVSKAYVSHCLAINPTTGDFLRKDPYIREGIAHYLDMSYQDIWGETKPCYRKPEEEPSASGQDQPDVSSGELASICN